MAIKNGLMVVGFRKVWVQEGRGCGCLVPLVMKGPYVDHVDAHAPAVTHSLALQAVAVEGNSVRAPWDLFVLILICAYGFLMTSKEIF